MRGVSLGRTYTRRAVALALLIAVQSAACYPTCQLDSRRLILVRAPAACDAAAVCSHIVATHGDDIKYAMGSTSEDALNLLDMTVEAIQKRRIAKLATSKSSALQEVDHSEPIDDAAFRALEARDYMLRGTMDGAASLLISHESLIELILCRANDVESDIEDLPRGVTRVPTISVLDFGVGSYPWQVADERPFAQPQWDLTT